MAIASPWIATAFGEHRKTTTCATSLASTRWRIELPSAICLSIASSLSDAAITRFLKKHSLDEFFGGVWNRDNSGGIKAVPLVRALRGASLQPENIAFLTDTVEGIKVARTAGVHPILMMNDPDEARRLATHNPAGGVVSMHEIPDFIRLIAAQNSQQV